MVALLRANNGDISTSNEAKDVAERSTDSDIDLILHPK